MPVGLLRIPGRGLYTHSTVLVDHTKIMYNKEFYVRLYIKQYLSAESDFDESETSPLRACRNDSRTAECSVQN